MKPTYKTESLLPESFVKLNAADVVLTPDHIAVDMIRHFKPTGRVLDPCRGNGAFSDKIPGCLWCEIEQGVDFFTWNKRVDWIISNPPYSIFNEWLPHSLAVATDIVYLIPLAKLYSAEKRLADVFRVGGIVETRVYGNGTECGFPFGWPTGAVHMRVGYSGPMRWSFFKRVEKQSV